MSDEPLSEHDRLTIVAGREKLISEGWEVSEDGRIVYSPDTVEEILRRADDGFVPRVRMPMDTGDERDVEDKFEDD